MSAIVKPRRGDPSFTPVVSGATIRSKDWMSACDLSNWVRGKGKTLIPFSWSSGSTSAGGFFYLKFRVLPHVTGLRRVWKLLVGGTGRVQSDYDSVWHSFSSSDERTAVPFTFTEDVTSATSTEYEASIRVEALGSTTARVFGVGLDEYPRTVLGLDSTDLGVDINTTVFREPIRFSNNSGLYGIGKVFSDYTNIHSRGLFHWARSSDTTNAFITTAGPDAVFPVDVPVLAPKKFSGYTTETAYWRVYARVSGAGVGGTVSVYNPKTGTTTNITVTSGATSYAWYPTTAGAASSFTIDCEDLSTSNGLQGGTFNDLQFTATRTGSAGSLYVASISVNYTP